MPAVQLLMEAVYKLIVKGRRQKAEGFYVYDWYMVVWAVKFCPNLYGDRYILK